MNSRAYEYVHQHKQILATSRGSKQLKLFIFIEKSSSFVSLYKLI